MNAVSRLARRAEKDLDDLPPALAAKAQEIIERLDSEPHIGKKLFGPLQGRRSARLGRSHRIIYTMTREGIVVLTISHRRDAYR